MDEKVSQVPDSLYLEQSGSMTFGRKTEEPLRTVEAVLHRKFRRFKKYGEKSLQTNPECGPGIVSRETMIDGRISAV